MGQSLLALRPRHESVAGPSIDRDLSQIEFHRRVFDEARDETNPLLERVKFLSILGTIVEEFSATRCAELAAQADRRTFGQVETEINELLAEARLYLREQLTPALAANGIHLLDCADLQPKERAEVNAYFTESVLPLLMPLGFDAARPFPHISGRGIALAVIVRSRGKDHFCCVEVPEGIPTLVAFHRRGARSAAPRPHAVLEQGFVWLHELIGENLAAIFPETEIVEVHPFRIRRKASLDTELPEGVGLREAIERGLWRREFGDVLALTVGEHMPASMVELLSKNLATAPCDVHASRELTDLSKLDELSRLDRPELQNPPLAPRSRSGEMFASIRQGDILLHHPYESFQPVIDFLEEAASDPDVLAISTTLYRAGRNSPIVNALLAARRAGKQVRAVIELRARFDEAHNLAWGHVLEQAGAHVVYGLVDFKVHAKATLIVRREAGRLQRYVHLSSGNYNPATATVYTDLGLFSCREGICSDATRIFNVLTGYGSPADFQTLLVAPLTLRERVTDFIERESRWALQGQPAHMILKMNALADMEIIEHFYRASQAGVQIDLIVRGICCLRPGVPGLSDNIRVRSIVGRFLEHSRAWYFRNGGHEEIYVGSADLMARNLDERVEVMVPLEDAALKRRVRREILDVYLADNVKARELMPDGRYVRVGREAGAAAINSQECLL